jgi:hypothetical protein
MGGGGDGGVDSTNTWQLLDHHGVAGGLEPVRQFLVVDGNVPRPRNDNSSGKRHGAEVLADGSKERRVGFLTVMAAHES